MLLPPRISGRQVYLWTQDLRGVRSRDERAPKDITKGRGRAISHLPSRNGDIKQIGVLVAGFPVPVRVM